MKKILIIITTAVFALSLLSSCGSKGCGCPGGAGYPKHSQNIIKSETTLNRA